MTTATWTWTCPCCPGRLTSTAAGGLVCPVCALSLPSPPRPPRPLWETAPDPAWDRYQRSGDLAERWGTSTHRADGGPPRDGAPDPTVRALATLGVEDRLLDASRAGYVAGTAALVDGLRALQARAHRPPRPAILRGRHGAAKAILLAHVGAAPSPGPARAREGRWVPALDGLAHAIALLAANLLLRRGVDVWAVLRVEGEGGDPIASPLPRAERWAGPGHAAALALSAPELAPRPSAPAAPGRHPIPSGLVFGQMAVAPTHVSGGRAPGLDALLDAVDARALFASLPPADQAALARGGEGLAPEQRAALRRARERWGDTLRERGLVPSAPRRRRTPAVASDPWDGVGA